MALFTVQQMTQCEWRTIRAGLSASAANILALEYAKDGRTTRIISDIVVHRTCCPCIPGAAIVSGEGEGEGSVTYLEGPIDVTAILRALAVERSGGNRWAYLRLDGQRIDDEHIAYALRCRV